MKPFIVIQSNPSNEGKTFVTKLQRETVVSDPIFGDKKKKETYYISGTKQVEVGTEVSHDAIFPKYKSVEHPGVIPDGPQAGLEIMLNWLHLA